MLENQINLQEIMKTVINNPELFELIQQKMNPPTNEYIRSSPTIIKKVKNNLDELESQLFRFFKMILMDSEKIKKLGLNESEIIRINKNDPKINVNYYDIIKSEVYVDLSLPIEEIKEKVFGQIFYPNIVKKVHKRIEKSQTTEYIISNPVNEVNEERSFFIYDNFLYLEFEGNKLSTSSKLKDGDELYLKLSKDMFNEINTFPKTKNIVINYENHFFTSFLMSEKGISYKIFKKLFNTELYPNTLTIYDDNIFNTLNFIPGSRTIGAGDFGELMFMDPSDATIKQFSLSKKAPKWRIISEGLNIFGICENPECEAHKKEVIYRTLKYKSLPEEGLLFDMLENRDKIRCPICNKLIDPKTCGFYKCEYQFRGQKKENLEVKKYDSKPKETEGNKVSYYEPKGKKQTIWFKLKIYVLPIQKMKYKPQ